MATNGNPGHPDLQRKPWPPTEALATNGTQLCKTQRSQRITHRLKSVQLTVVPVYIALARTYSLTSTPPNDHDSDKRYLTAALSLSHKLTSLFLTRRPQGEGEESAVKPLRRLPLCRRERSFRHQ